MSRPGRRRRIRRRTRRAAGGQGDPENCTLNGFDCAGAPADHTAPTRPGPLEFDLADGVALTWAPYEVYLDGEPIGQVGDTAITVAAPPAGEHTFAVRTINAVDRYSDPAELTYPVS